MCGIFSYTGSSSAAEIVFDGLKKLEYRGYDSWGVATIGSDVKVIKNIGKIGSANPKFPRSNIAIGHTRWATHGGVTVSNSHPHTDCTGRIFVVHNGIIENFLEIKKELELKGHKFNSETDTEVFPHLVEELLSDHSFKRSCHLAFKKIKGLSTLVVADSSTGEIAAYKNGSPLVAGIGDDNAIYLSSDIPALLGYTNKIAIIEDGQSIFIDTKSIRKYSSKGIPDQKLITHELDFNHEISDLGSYDHFLIKEIHEQPRVIENLSKIKDEEISRYKNIIKSANNLFSVACGTAAFASLAGSYYFSSLAGLDIHTIVGSEFRHFINLINSKSLLISSSQSGETMDTLVATKAAMLKKAKTLAVVNVPSSSLARLTDYSFMLKAGPEQAVLSTKSYIAKLTFFLLLSASLANKLQESRVLLRRTSREIKKFLKDNTLIKNLADSIYTQDHIYIVGRGINYPTALEGALKIKESSYIHAEGFAGGELKHGVIALIEQGTPCIVIQAEDEDKEDSLSSAMELRARGGYIIGIAPENNPAFDYWIKVADLGIASPLINIVPLQLLAYELTLLRGHDPDKPRNLAKSVTVK